MKKIFILIISIPILFSCNDIFEEDIENDTVNLIYPNNNSEITNNDVNFTWSKLSGASNYRFQIFKSENNLLLKDTLINKNEIDIYLSNGIYSWRVRAENSGYSSLYSPNNFLKVN